MPSSSSSTINSSSMASADAPTVSFPAKLYAMLEDASKEGFESTISWQPDGESFKVHKIDTFTKAIMQKYFNQTKYKSFQRQLNIYGWKKIPYGPDKGGYKHPYFIRGHPELFDKIHRRIDSRSSRCVKTIKEEEEAMSPTASTTTSPTSEDEYANALQESRSAVGTDVRASRRSSPSFCGGAHIQTEYFDQAQEGVHQLPPPLMLLPSTAPHLVEEATATLLLPPSAAGDSHGQDAGRTTISASPDDDFIVANTSWYYIPDPDRSALLTAPIDPLLDEQFVLSQREESRDDAGSELKSFLDFIVYPGSTLQVEEESTFRADISSTSEPARCDDTSGGCFTTEYPPNVRGGERAYEWRTMHTTFPAKTRDFPPPPPAKLVVLTSTPPAAARHRFSAISVLRHDHTVSTEKDRRRQEQQEHRRPTLEQPLPPPPPRWSPARVGSAQLSYYYENNKVPPPPIDKAAVTTEPTQESCGISLHQHQEPNSWKTMDFACFHPEEQQEPGQEQAEDPLKSQKFLSNEGKSLNKFEVLYYSEDQRYASWWEQETDNLVAQIECDVPPAEDFKNDADNTSSSNFPFKLHRLLDNAEQEGYVHLVSWVKGGTAFKVHDYAGFVKRVMPMYFDQSKYESFRRQLNLYQFTRVSKGGDWGVISHPCFMKGTRHRCHEVCRRGNNNTTNADEAVGGATSRAK